MLWGWKGTFANVREADVAGSGVSEKDHAQATDGGIKNSLETDTTLVLVERK